MKLFDSHAHLYDSAFDEDRKQIIQLVLSRLDYVVCPSENLETSRKSIALSDTYDRIYAAIGIHPQRTDKATLNEWETIMTLARTHKKVVAIGEIGLDYFRMNADKETQKKWFEIQIEGAKELDLPIIIHDRDAHGDILQILKDHKDERLRGIMHCYGGSIETARELMKLGFYISFAGPVAFPKSRRVKETARQIPLERLLIETDSPYMAPPPHRGERNNPVNVLYIAEEIARLKGITTEEVAEATWKNAKHIFRI